MRGVHPLFFIVEYIILIYSNLLEVCFMFHVKRFLPGFILIMLFLTACDGSKKGADQEGLKEFDA